MLTDASYGTYVVDREADDPDPAVIVNRPDVPANEWETAGGESTVAQDNPNYPVDSDIIVVVFESDLDAFDAEWDSFAGADRSLEELAAAGVPYYAFPRDRLEPAPEELLGESIDPTPKTAKLLSELDEGGIDCHLESEDTIVCEKFGEEYRIQPGEVVSGEGVLTSQLDSIAKQYA